MVNKNDESSSGSRSSETDFLSYRLLAYPSSSDVAELFGKAKELIHSNRDHDAIEALKTVAAIDPLNASAKTLLGHVYYSVGEWRKARWEYMKALRLGDVDPSIAQFLEDIEYAFPWKFEKEPPQNMDPFIATALGYVQDQWLAISLAAMSREEREKFDEAVTTQVIAQQGEIRWGDRHSVNLLVPVAQMTATLAGHIVIPEGAGSNPTLLKLNAAIHKTLDYFIRTSASSQGRVCKVQRSEFRLIREGFSVVWVSFQPIESPLFAVHLAFQFADSPVVNGVKRPVYDEKGRRLTWKNSFECVARNALVKIPYNDSKQFFTRDERGDDILYSLADVDQCLRSQDSIFFIQPFSSTDLPSDLDAMGVKEELKEALVQAMPKGVIKAIWKVSPGKDVLECFRERGPLRGIRLVQCADLGFEDGGPFYAIFFTSESIGRVRRFKVRIDVLLALGEDGIKLRGPPDLEEE